MTVLPIRSQQNVESTNTPSIPSTPVSVDGDRPESTAYNGIQRYDHSRDTTMWGTVTPETTTIDDAKSRKGFADLSLHIPQKVSENDMDMGSSVSFVRQSPMTNEVNGQTEVNQEQKVSEQRIHRMSCSVTQRGRVSGVMKSGISRLDNHKRRPPRSPLPQLRLTMHATSRSDGNTVDVSPYSPGAPAVRIDSKSRGHTSVCQNFNPSGWARVDSPTAADIPPTPGSPPAEPFQFPPAAANSHRHQGHGDRMFDDEFSKQSTPGPLREPARSHLSISCHRGHISSESGAPPSPMGPPRLSVSPILRSPVDANQHDEPCSPATPNRRFLEQNFSQMHISTYQAWQEHNGLDHNSNSGNNDRERIHDMPRSHNMSQTRDQSSMDQASCTPSMSGQTTGKQQSKGRDQVSSMISFELYRKEDRLPHTCFTRAMQRNYVRTLSPDELSFLMKKQKELVELCEQVRRRANRTIDTSGSGLSSNRLATRPVDTRSGKKQNVGKILDTCLTKRNMLISKKSRKDTHQTRKQQLMSIRAHTFFGRSNPRDASQATL